jgi:hypothetical protein
MLSEFFSLVSGDADSIAAYLVDKQKDPNKFRNFSEWWDYQAYLNSSGELPNPLQGRGKGQ